MSATLLEVAGVEAGYGGSPVLRDVTLTVGAGEVVALLGPNGAGKSTLLNAVSGIARVTAGRIALDGRPLQRLPAHKIAAAGVAHVPQGRKLFGYSTGRENLAIGGFARSDRGALDTDVDAFLERWPVARRVEHQRAHLMSGGEQQVVALGRGLLALPRLLMLDEPSLGLAPVLVEEVTAMIRSLRREKAGDGLGILLVEQNAGKALELADRVYVLATGRIVHSGPAAELTPRTVVDMYLGRGSR